MTLPLLIVISGPPATGKTTLGTRIATDFQLPYVYKDGIKESLFDSLGVGDREWSRALGHASTELIYYFVAAQLAAGRSCIAESNFDSKLAPPRFRDVQQAHPHKLIQIQCRTDPAVLLARSRLRAPTRHPGHLAAGEEAEMHQRFADLPDAERGSYPTLDIGGMLFVLDTTDTARLDMRPVYNAIAAALAEE